MLVYRPSCVICGKRLRELIRVTCSYACRRERLRQQKRSFPEPPPIDNARWVTLGAGQWALVDAEDFDRVDAFEWHLHHVSGYVVSSAAAGKHKPDYLHRVVLGCVRSDQTCVDHKDRNKIDCRKENLQAVPQSINNFNRIKGYSASSTSTFKGVYLYQGRWVARITLPIRNRIPIGTFDDEIEVAKAYDAAARKYFGSDARINFPEPGEKGCRVDVPEERGMTRT